MLLKQHKHVVLLMELGQLLCIVCIAVKYPDDLCKIDRNLLVNFNPLNAKLNLICPLLALFGAHRILPVSR